MEALREIFHHHAWATLALIDHCANLTPEQLQEAVPGTYGPIVPTLAHLVGADAGYLRHITGQQPDPRPDEQTGLAELRSRFESQAQRWEAVLDRVDTFEVTIPAEPDWPETPHAVNLVVVQAIHHGNDHRTQVCSTLGALGLPVPELSGWMYWLTAHPQGQ